MFLGFLEPFLDNLLPSIVILLQYIILIIVETIVGIIVLVRTKKEKKRKSLFMISTIIGLSIWIMFIIGTPEPKINVKRVIDKNELLGKWTLTDIPLKKENKASKYSNYFELYETGLCKLSSIDYKSSGYIKTTCKWSLEHNIRADNDLYENNVLVLTIDNPLDKRYFYFKQQEKELILYNYYLNDWYNKIEYRKLQMNPKNQTTLLNFLIPKEHKNSNPLNAQPLQH